MKIINVHTSKEYSVLIGSDLLSVFGATCASSISSRHVAVISDSNVWDIYGRTLCQSLEDAGFDHCHYVFQAGEPSKNGQTYLSILNFLAENHLTRQDCLVALGGGVVGDLTGFAAATYLRGISYVQVPTTLLAMVDSSVGGKTAIDLPAGKNLAGAFYQPDLVICDIDCLSTLPEDRFIDGCAEVIKYATVFDEALFAQLQAQGRFFSPESVVARCVELKADVVAQDEFDCECRHLLNFGHTVGHAIEKASGYTISHGRAVAIGMAVISRASAAGGLCTPQVCNALDQLLSDFSLPTKTDIPLSLITPHLSSDKKRFDDKIDLILPATIGCAQIANLSFEQLESFIKAGM